MASKKRSVKVSGHETSITLEEEFWVELKNISNEKSISLSTLVTQIDECRINDNLSSAIRIFILQSLKENLYK